MSDKNSESYETISKIDNFCIMNFNCNWQAWRYYTDYRNHENVNKTLDEFVRLLQTAEEEIQRLKSQDEKMIEVTKRASEHYKKIEKENKILREAVDVAVREMEAGRYLPSIRKPLKQALEETENMEGKNERI